MILDSNKTPIDRTLSIAPMMGATDRHCRKLMRIISPHAFLFTEMVVTGALIHGDAAHFLRHADDDPCALQVGGNDPQQLAQCAILAESAGYQEINLNVGCPSDRVQSGGIGACLMAQPELVADCIAAMQASITIPVSVKCRIGIDDEDSYAAFSHFIHTVSAAGCEIFYVHARKAILSGLSPKQNREIPPLKYPYVYQISSDFPHCQFFLNGGLTSIETAIDELDRVKGVMLGRAPYSNPYMLAGFENALYEHQSPDRLEVVARYIEYARQCTTDHPKHLLKHLLGLFTGCPGARRYRRYLSETMYQADASVDLVYNALHAAGLDCRTSDRTFTYTENSTDQTAKGIQC
ncbi:MAG: tRNA dihydrouridine(20/20a) synthase DusA [Pseudomonadales bacterium]|nr:tRNA dihydrouridine(20/20a) synthase DusA [Pseudomonadales bacterium]